MVGTLVHQGNLTGLSVRDSVFFGQLFIKQFSISPCLKSGPCLSKIDFHEEEVSAGAKSNDYDLYLGTRDYFPICSVKSEYEGFENDSGGNLGHYVLEFDCPVHVFRNCEALANPESARKRMQGHCFNR